MERTKDIVRLGSGSACPGERLEPAVELVEKGDIDYIVFDSLSESEILAFERRKMVHPDPGYDLYTERRLRAILPGCARNGVKVVGNMGGANPEACQDLAVRIARELGLDGLKVAAVLGDNVLDTVKELDPETTETGQKISEFGDDLVSAYAYIPATSLVGALDAGADLVITGRVGDATLYLAPLMHELGWRDDDWDNLAKGTVVGHLMECGGQLSGGYFADPPYKVVPDLHRLGFPIAEVSPDGRATITKVPGTGGVVSPATCAEQMLYEVGDPTHYIEADGIADFSDIGFDQVAPDRVAITGTIKGRPRPERLKVSMGVREGYIAEGMIFYAGPGAYERARLAAETIEKRLEHVTYLKATELRFEFIGINALYGRDDGPPADAPWEVGMRVAGRTRERDEAWKIMHELETIDNNGPAGIARGLRKEDVREVLGYHSTLIPRDRVTTEYTVREA